MRRDSRLENRWLETRWRAVRIAGWGEDGGENGRWNNEPWYDHDEKQMSRTIGWTL